MTCALAVVVGANEVARYPRPITLGLSASTTVRLYGRGMTPALGFAKVPVSSPVIPCPSFAAAEPAKTFFPWAEARSSRGKKLPSLPSFAVLRPEGGCVADRLRLPDRHRGRGGRGLETSK